MDEKLLEIMCCPETHQPLAKAGAELVDDLNKRTQLPTRARGVDRMDHLRRAPRSALGGLPRRERESTAPATRWTR